MKTFHLSNSLYFLCSVRYKAERTERKCNHDYANVSKMLSLLYFPFILHPSVQQYPVYAFTTELIILNVNICSVI